MTPCPDQQQDVEAFLIAILQDAHRQADAVIAFLDAFTGMPTPAERRLQPIEIAPDLLAKIAALIRIAQWEKTGLRRYLRTELPSSQEVLQDLFQDPSAGTPRFDGRALAQAVLWTHLTQLAWPRLPNPHADVAIAQGLSPEEALDALARFLWQFRHLGN